MKWRAISARPWTEVPKEVMDAYRKIEDPVWLERELLRSDDRMPTSRADTMRQAVETR
jgi:hypothetical protein